MGKGKKITNILPAHVSGDCDTSVALPLLLEQEQQTEPVSEPEPETTLSQNHHVTPVTPIEEEIRAPPRSNRILLSLQYEQPGDIQPLLQCFLKSREHHTPVTNSEVDTKLQDLRKFRAEVEKILRKN